MKLRRSLRYAVHSVALSIPLLFGCPTDTTDGDGSDNVNINDNGGATGGFQDNDLEAPGPLDGNVVNTPPTGELTFPVFADPAENSIGTGPVVFEWDAVDADGTNLDSTVFVATDPDVFNSSFVSAGLRSPPEETVHRLTIQFPDTGTFFWGLLLSDGVNTVQVPSNGEGAEFSVSTDGIIRVDAEGVILLCPSNAQPARSATTFSWSLGGVVPTQAQVFVSRAGAENPFNSPLSVFDVAIATDTSRALLDTEALPLGEDLAWGLRLETPDEVLFTFEGQLGASFRAEENVPPSGELLSPMDGAAWSDSDMSFILTWHADSGNCEDEVFSTVFFELLAGSSDEDSLFDSPISLELPLNDFDVDLFLLDSLAFQAGVWRWGVLADDDTDKTRLPNGLDPADAYRTFVRDTTPRFIMVPTIVDELCEPAQRLYDAVAFSFTDDNGIDTVNVTLTYSTLADDLFTTPSATLSPVPGASVGDSLVFLRLTDFPECPDFDHGAGFYGVELDDGVNGPVRAMVEYAGPAMGACCFPDGSCADRLEEDCSNGAYEGDDTTCATTACPQPPAPPDCNGNGNPDDLDISQGVSFDCNSNGVPDECEGSPIVVEAGTLLPGVIDGQGGYSSSQQGNDLIGTVCPPQVQLPGTSSLTLWTVDSAPLGSEVQIIDPTVLATPFIIFSTAIPGDYVFRLTLLTTQQSDTVTFTLEQQIP